MDAALLCLLVEQARNMDAEARAAFLASLHPEVRHTILASLEGGR